MAESVQDVLHKEVAKFADCPPDTVLSVKFVFPLVPENSLTPRVTYESQNGSGRVPNLSDLPDLKSVMTAISEAMRDHLSSLTLSQRELIQRLEIDTKYNLFEYILDISLHEKLTQMIFSLVSSRLPQEIRPNEERDISSFKAYFNEQSITSSQFGITTENGSFLDNPPDSVGFPVLGRVNGSVRSGESVQYQIVNIKHTTIDHTIGRAVLPILLNTSAKEIDGNTFCESVKLFDTNPTGTLRCKIQCHNNTAEETS